MTRVFTLLTDRFADWECALFLGAGRSFYGFECKTASPDGKPVVSAGGMKVLPDLAFGDIEVDAFDVLLVCGGNAWDTETAPEISGLLRKASDAGKLIGGICAGTRPLAAAGLLDKRAHTSNAADYLAAVPGYAGQAAYRNGNRAVLGDRIVTAPGWAPVSFTKLLLEELGFGGTDLDHYLGLHAAQHQEAA